MIIIAGRRRIKDRNMRWKEHYGNRSSRVKKKLEKLLPGSYFRFEAKDYESGHPYYVVVGPSVSKRYGKAFFAGVKKLPLNPKQHKVYSPSGKYFFTLNEALKYAHDLWGISIPVRHGNYTHSDLKNIEIPRHLKG